MDVDIDTAWRKLLSPANVRTIIDLLRSNIRRILRRAHDLEFLTLRSQDVETLAACKELTHVRDLVNRQAYGGDERKWGDVKRTFIDIRNRPAGKVSRADANRLVETMTVISNSAHVLVYFRNVDAHDHSLLGDPGAAAALAGTILHITEQLTAPTDEDGFTALRRDAFLVLKLCAESEFSDQEDATTDAGNDQDDPDSLVGQKVDEVRRDLSAGIESLLVRTPDRAEFREWISEGVQQALATYSATKPERPLRSRLTPSGDNSDHRDRSTFLDRDPPYPEKSEAGVGGEPASLTPIQATNALLALRNRIRMERRTSGHPIENWQNICQRPIVNQLVMQRVSNVDDWNVAGGAIGIKYEDWKNRQVMDEQLSDYGDRMFEIVRSITDERPDEDDIPL